MSLTLMSPFSILLLNDNGALNDMSACVMASCKLCIRSVNGAHPKKQSLVLMLLSISPMRRRQKSFVSSRACRKCISKPTSARSLVMSTISPVIFLLEILLPAFSTFISAEATALASHEGLRQTTLLLSPLQIVACLVVWSCPKKITSMPSTWWATRSTSSSLQWVVLMPPFHPL